MILFLDDDPNRAALAYQRWPEDKRNETMWTTTVEGAIDVLYNYDVEEAHLDHDLGGQTYVHSSREDCGMEIVRWLEKLSKNNPEKFKKFGQTEFIVHTHNYPAGAEMTARMIQIGLKTEYVPFGYAKCRR